MVVGVLFLLLAGIDLFYNIVWLGVDNSDEPELEGHPVKYNKTGALVPVVSFIISLMIDKSFILLWNLLPDGNFPIRYDVHC